MNARSIDFPDSDEIGPRLVEVVDSISGTPTDPQALELLPPIHEGSSTPAQVRRVHKFYRSVESLFRLWLDKSKSPNTRRAYRTDINAFVEFLEIDWPQEDFRLLQTTVADVVSYRDHLVESGVAPKTLSRRISSLSSLFSFLARCAGELRLPITVPNPAHRDFIERGGYDPVDETEALSMTQARQLMGLPSGESELDYRDRALIKFFLYTGVRVSTAARLNVGDFVADPDDPKVRIQEKGRLLGETGGSKRTIGVHFACAEAIAEHLKRSGIERGPLFPSRRAPRSDELGHQRMAVRTIAQVMENYLRRIPGAMVEDRCRFTVHSLRATTATILLDAGVDLRKVQTLLGHKKVTTTQVYDKRRRGSKESASHDMPL